MAELKYHMNGLGELRKAVLERANLSEIKDVVESNITEVQQKAMKKAGDTYTKTYKSGKNKGKRISTGATKEGIAFDLSNGGLTGTVGMPQEYNPYTEKGTRFMAAEPVLDPVFHDQKGKFKSDLERLMK